MSHDVAAGEEEEEGRKAVGRRGPRRVTTEEREEHEKTHLPYRDWCEVCVKARGRKMAHRRKEDEEENVDVPRISMDYLFLTESDRSASKNPVFVMVDEATGNKFARAVSKKGVGIT